ncbi:hypothetical protein KBI5_10250 [Frankia sp. KB5]|nr:hypothetical protein KBI5_10250 [Frankia sp. KB5]
MTMPQPATALRIDDPTHIGVYRLRGRLGVGGMGVVYLAEDPHHHPVAVKVIRVEFAADPEFRARFRHEAEAARRVPRFCTAAFLDADPNAERPYLVTDYVPGPTLAQAARRPLRGAELEQVAVHIAVALTVIHGAGVVHRDLKPSNVILSPTGARVIDFGIARAHGMTMFHIDEQIGTPAYTAPENIDGAPPDPAADIFAWGGVVLYAATGQPPFGDRSSELLLHRIRYDHPTHLNQLHGRLHDTVTAAMAKAPEQRPTAEQLYRMLTSTQPPTPPPAAPTRHGRQGPQPAPPPPAIPPHYARPIPPARRTRITILATATAVVLAAAVLLITDRPRHTPTTANRPDRHGAAAILADQATTDDPDLAVRLAVAAYRFNPDPAARIALLAAAARGLPPLATFRHSGKILSVAISPDGHTLATGSADHTARLWNPTHPDQPVATLGHDDGVNHVAFNPAGTLLATTSDDTTIRLWNITDPHHPDQVNTLTLHTGGTPYGAAFNPAGTLLAISTSTGAVLLIDITDPRATSTLATFTPHSYIAGNVAFSPDGHTLATASLDGTARLWDVTDPRTPRPLATLAPGPTFDATFSPDGTMLATAQQDGTTLLWTLTTPTQPQPAATIPETGMTTTAVFAPDGTTLATASTDGTAHLWDLTNPRTPRPLATLTGHTGPVETLAFDGTMLATAGDDTTARLWDLNPTSLTRRACTTPTGRLSEDEWHRYLPTFPYQPPCP